MITRSSNRAAHDAAAFHKRRRIKSHHHHGREAFGALSRRHFYTTEYILDSLKKESLARVDTTKSFKSDGGDESDENDIQNERDEKSSHQERSTRVPPRQKKRKNARVRALNLGFWS